MWTGPFAYGRADVTSVLLNFFSISFIFFSFVFAIIGDGCLALNDKISYFILKNGPARGKSVLLYSLWCINESAFYWSNVKNVLSSPLETL